MKTYHCRGVISKLHVVVAVANVQYRDEESKPWNKEQEIHDIRRHRLLYGLYEEEHRPVEPQKKQEPNDQEQNADALANEDYSRSTPNTCKVDVGLRAGPEPSP